MIYAHLGRYTILTGLADISAEMPDRTSGLPLLPLSSKEKEGRQKEEKDSKLKDEFHKLLNGNHVDPTDRVMYTNNSLPGNPTHPIWICIAISVTTALDC